MPGTKKVPLGNGVGLTKEGLATASVSNAGSGHGWGGGMDFNHQQQRL
jgi:hypothetical protein